MSNKDTELTIVIKFGREGRSTTCKAMYGNHAATAELHQEVVEIMEEHEQGLSRVNLMNRATRELIKLIEAQ